MPTSEFFTQYGLFVVKEFFDHEFCAQICVEIRAEATQGVIKQNTVWTHESDNIYINEEVKSRTEFVKPSLDSYPIIRQKLIDLMPKVAAHFSLELKDCQKIKFTIYKAGDFFKQHVDVVNHENAPQEIKDRKISVVIFLNDEASQAGESNYVGGNLTFYGLIPNSVFSNFGLPLIAESGLLIAFSPQLLHEVTPVINGERYVLVTWYA